MSGGVRVHWDASEGWIADVPFALSAPELERAVAFALRAQGDRVRSWPPGGRKDQARRALAELAVGRGAIVQQRVVAPGEQVLYGR